MIPLDDYRARAERNGPKTAAELRQAAQQMIRDGLGEHTVAAALQLDVNAVRRLVGSCAECET